MRPQSSASGKEPAEQVIGQVNCAVLGSPIEHSLSPVLHRAAYAALGLENWAYGRYEVAEAELADFVASRDQSWRGLSLTMPLKFVALELGEVDRLAQLVGAANTLIFDAEGRRLYNTDVGGLVSAVRRVGVEEIERAVILGSGATARSALASASQLGAEEIVVMARDPAKAADLEPLAEALGTRLSILGWSATVPRADLLISTVTAGAADARAADWVAAAPCIFDVIYDPWPTALAATAEAAGRAVVNGLDLLVGQALEQVELMTGHAVEAEVLLSAGRAALGARGRLVKD